MFNNAAIFLIKTTFNFFILVFLLRIILQWVSARFYNPISQFVIKLTNPVVVPLRKYLHSMTGLDTASIVFVILLEIIKLILLTLVVTGALPSLIGLLLWAVGDLLSFIINIFFFSIILVIILSWLPGIAAHSLHETLYLITEPILQPARRIIPPLAGLDISPMLVLIVLKLIDILIAQNLIALGASSS